MHHLFIITLMLYSTSAMASPPAIVPFTGYVTKDVNKVSLQLELVDDANSQILWCQKNANVAVAKRRFMVNIGQLVNGTSVCATGDYEDLGLNANNIVNAFTLELFNRKILQVRLKIDGERIDTPQALTSIPYAAYTSVAERSWTSDVADLATRSINADDGNPPGTVQPYVGSALPTGWLWCDGRSYNRTSYPDLATAMGGSGSTFTVPDLRGRFLRGLNDMDGGGSSPGSDTGTNRDPSNRTVLNLQADSTAVNGLGTTSSVSDPGHVHRQRASNFVATGVSGSNGHGERNASSATMDTSRSTSGISVSTSINGDTETRPVNVAVRYIIKY